MTIETINELLEAINYAKGRIEQIKKSKMTEFQKMKAISFYKNAQHTNALKINLEFSFSYLEKDN